MDQFGNFRCTYERSLMNVITESTELFNVLQNHDTSEQMNFRQQMLLSDGVKASPKLFPHLYSLFQDCLDILNLDHNANLYIVHGSEPNASVLHDQNRLDVTVSSSLVQDFSTPELKFVIGHELGHVLFGHSEFSINNIHQSENTISLADAIIAFKWSRAAEISADRIGLLCCDHVENAVSALFRTACGLPVEHYETVLATFREQYDSLASLLASDSTSPGFLLRSHPITPIRVRALEYAFMDIISFRSKPSTFSWKSFRNLDDQIGELIDRVC
jgi:Zn-dependent protease with chaperone function